MRYSPLEHDTTIPFHERVWMATRRCPPGRVTTYGALARHLGTGRSSRMVGWALNLSHEAGVEVPAHRVVNRMGLLTGKMHFPGPNMMQERLEAEGVRVVDDQVQHFQELFWDPAAE